VNAPRLNPSQIGRYSIYLPRRDGRLSWPRRLVTSRDGLPAYRQSPIAVLVLQRILEQKQFSWAVAYASFGFNSRRWLKAPQKSWAPIRTRWIQCSGFANFFRQCSVFYVASCTRQRRSWRKSLTGVVRLCTMAGGTLCSCLQTTTTSYEFWSTSCVRPSTLMLARELSSSTSPLTTLTKTSSLSSGSRPQWRRCMGAGEGTITPPWIFGCRRIDGKSRPKILAQKCKIHGWKTTVSEEFRGSCV